MIPLDIAKVGKLVRPNDRGSYLLYDTKIIDTNGHPSFFISQDPKVLNISVGRSLLKSLAYFYDP